MRGGVHHIGRMSVLSVGSGWVSEIPVCKKILLACGRIDHPLVLEARAYSPLGCTPSPPHHRVCRSPRHVLLLRVILAAAAAAAAAAAVTAAAAAAAAAGTIAAAAACTTAVRVPVIASHERGDGGSGYGPWQEPGRVVLLPGPASAEAVEEGEEGGGGGGGEKPRAREGAGGH